MRRYRNVILAGLLIAGVVAISSSWFASGDPDGLERVAEDQQVLDRAKEPGHEVLPDYTVPGVDGAISTALAGVIGVGVVAALALGAGYVLRARGGDGGTGGAGAGDAGKRLRRP